MKTYYNEILYRDVFECTLTSGSDERRIKVVASSFGQAAEICLSAICEWENRDAYVLTNIKYVDFVVVNPKNFSLYA